MSLRDHRGEGEELTGVQSPMATVESLILFLKTIDFSNPDWNLVGSVCPGGAFTFLWSSVGTDPKAHPTPGTHSPGDSKGIQGPAVLQASLSM